MPSSTILVCRDFTNVKSNRIKLQGKTVFIIAMITIGVTALTVYLTGINYHRSVSSNLYISLGIIAAILFLFLTYGLFHGIRLVNNYPKFEWFERGMIFESPKMPEFGWASDDGLVGILLSVLLWIGMSLLAIVVLVLFEALIWLSLFVFFAMLYWVFLRALKLVLTKSAKTRGNLGLSAFTSLGYTLLYTGWLFVIAFVVQGLT